MSTQPHQSSLDSRQSRPLSPRSHRLSRFLTLSALALVVGVLSACGSSDSGEDVEREAAAGTGECDAPPAPEVDWSGCDKSDANLRGANLSGAMLIRANLSAADLPRAKLPQAPRCSNGTVWPDGTTGQGRECP